MTKINRIVMNGFKSFGKHTELLFGENFNCVLGPNGSGKCVDGNTLVSLADGSVIKIKNLVSEKLRTNNKREIDDGEIADGDDTQILCLDTDSLKTVKKRIKAFVKRTSPESLLRIRTKSGREITATTYHPLFVLNNEKIECVKAEELKKGVKIAVPRKINIEPETKYFYELLDVISAKDGLYVPYDEQFREILTRLKKTTWEKLAKDLDVPLNVLKGLLDEQSINFTYLVRILRYAGFSDKKIIKHIPKIKGKTTPITCNMIWKNSPDFSRFLGYLIAEGRLPPEVDQIWFVNEMEEIVEDYYNLIRKLFGIRATINEYKPNCYDVLAYSQPLRKLLTKFGMSLGKTEDKKLTNLFLQHSSNKELSHFVSGLYSGDGYVGKNSIEIVTKSKELGSAIEIILLRLGIRYKSKYVVKMATNSNFEGIYKQISFYGVENFEVFNDNVKLVHKKKQKRILDLLDKKANPNVDLIQVNSLINKVSKELKINVKKTKKQFPRLDSYVYNQCTPSRLGVNKLIKEVFVPASNNKGLVSKSLATLESISQSDIFWDEIVRIDKIKANDKWVYDLCVDEHHNFVANNFFVHNSNVLDALTFVLGKSSAKSLRAEKAANLIYNGGKSKKPSSKGEVSIFFDNKDKTFPTDEEHVKITRIVKPSGQSLYKINDQKRTRQQILDLLAVAKIDPDGYNIILQGDIVRFTEMHANDRRLLVEEISGISVYEEKKNKALKELEKVESKANDADIILGERKTYLRELKKDRDQALKYKSMNDQIKINKASYLKIQIDKKEKEKAELDKRISKNKEQLGSLNEKIGKIRTDSEENKQKIEEISKEIEEKGEVEQIRLNREVESLKIELTKKNSRKETVGSEIRKIEKRKEDLQATLKEIDANVENLNLEREEIEKQKKRVASEKQEIENKIKDLKEKNKLDSLGNIEQEIEEIDRKSDELQAEIQKLKEKQHDLLREKDRVEHQISTIDERIDKVKEVEAEYKKQIDDLKKAQEEFKKLTLELNKRLDEDSSLAMQINNLRQKLSKAREDLAKLEAREVGIREAGSDMAVKKILNKNIKGVYGTIAELGNVDEKYSLALQVAAGPRIKSVVVDSDKVASQCISFLKQNRFGVVTFLPLNKIREIKPSAAVKTMAKDSHGLALDLVKFDNKFKSVFSYVFGNTVVVDNIETARKLGIGKARMVTLDGDLAEASGAMVGGYRKKKAYGFKEKDLMNDIKTGRDNIKEMEKSVDVLEKRRAQNEGKIVKLREDKAALEGEIIKTEKSLHLEHGEIDVSVKQKDVLNKELEDIEKRLAEVDDKVSEINKELTDIKINRQGLRDRISELRNPSLVAELSAFEEKRNEFNEQIVKFDSEIGNFDTQINSIYEPEKEKTRQIMRQIEKDKESFVEENGELGKAISDLTKELEEKEEQSKKFLTQFKSLFEKRNTISLEIQKNERLIEDKRKDSHEIEIKMNTLSLKNAEVKAKLSGLNQEFEQYHGVKIISKDEEELKREIGKFERLRDQIGNVNLRALEIYEEVEKEYNKLLEKKGRLMKEKEEVEKMMQEIEGKKKELFMRTYEVINENFIRIFGLLSKKGSAHLQLENKEDPFAGGLSIKVKITGNKFLDIRSLSGGEKTMTALAFIFSIQEHEPAKFYVLDEVDAALDKHNSEKFAKLIGKYAENAQYIIITHNDAVISEASNLYGVSMDEHGISKVVSLKI